MLENGDYALVLSDLQMESPRAGLKVIAHAKIMDYKPATALITAYHDHHDIPDDFPKSLFIKPEDIQGLLTKVASLISERATRRLHREMVLAGV